MPTDQQDESPPAPGVQGKEPVRLAEGGAVHKEGFPVEAALRPKARVSAVVEGFGGAAWLRSADPAGQYCTEDVDECQLMPNACQNGGTCHNTHGSYNCVCVNGWTGEDCSENIDDCASAACFHGATCHDRVASFYCECPHGRTGECQGPERRGLLPLLEGGPGAAGTSVGALGSAWQRGLAQTQTVAFQDL